MKKFNEQIQQQFKTMCSTGKLFRVSLSGQKIWDIYLNAFSKEHNPVFRDPSSTEHQCNHCNNFIRRYGNVVTMDENNNLVTMFDSVREEEYLRSASAMSLAIKMSPVAEVFFETFIELQSLPYESCSKNASSFRLGIDKNVKRYTKEDAELYGVVKPNEVRTFEHMYLDLPTEFVDKSGKSAEALMGEYRDSKNVFKRAMDEISIDTLMLVKDLINQGSLLDGQTHLYKIEQILPLKKAYDEMPSLSEKDNWCWVNSYKLPFAKFRNELIGVLCTELTEGEELNKACQSWNKRVDPANYMKATSPITHKQIQEAQEFVEENGYAESFIRRLATIDDIKASEIKHINIGEDKIKGISIFNGVKATKSQHKRNEFDGVEEIGIEKFMKDILPSCSSIEAYLKNSHTGNMVTMTTANNPDSKRIFKWDNNYSWTFNGNIAGKSQIKQAVKDAGGNVEGVLNFRLAWNNEGHDRSDLDAWAMEPDRTSIGYNTGYRKDSGNRRTTMTGQLDVDNTDPGSKLGVENITWTEKKKMKEGVYTLWVNQFSSRNSKGFQAEIEVDGEIYSYEYNQPVSGNIRVAEVSLMDGAFTIKHLLPKSGVSSKEIYGLETNNFHKVTLVCLSPNHWNGNSVGNKHYFFMLDGAKTPVSIRGFHNENLNSDLLLHRKVMEVLGAKSMIEPSEKQLSGLGFNATVNDELILKLSGSHKRVVKVKF